MWLLWRSFPHRAEESTALLREASDVLCKKNLKMQRLDVVREPTLVGFFHFNKPGESCPCPAASNHDTQTSSLTQPSGYQGHFAADGRRKCIFKVIKVAVFVLQLNLPPLPQPTTALPKGAAESRPQGYLENQRREEGFA